MEYKYEPIFGDQSLFDGAPEDAEIVGSQGQWYKTKSGKLYRLTPIQWKEVQVLGHTPLAMRRIIKEHKRWTWEDKKAGRLPDVGCKIAGKRTGINTVLFNNGDYIVTVSDGNCVGKYIADEVFAHFKPIETTAEKAQRERDEWIDNACSFICFYDIGRVDAIKSLEITYDKLKSGELQMPVKGGE